MVLAAMPIKSRTLFRKYLDFAPFNGSSKVVMLYDFIEASVLGPEKLELNYADFVPEAVILPSQVEKIASHLHQKLDYFLALQEIEAHPARHAPHTLAAYERLLPGSPLIDKQYRKISKRLITESTSPETFGALSRLEHMYLPARIAAGTKGQESIYDLPIQHRNDQFLLWHLIYTCARMNESRLLNRPWPTTAIQEIRQLKLNIKEGTPILIRAYAKVFDILDASELLDQFMKDTIAFLESHLKHISVTDLGDMFQYLLNVSFREIDLGKDKFEALAANIYRKLLGYGLLTQEGRMHPYVYKNIVSLHCKTGEFEWATQFIEEYQPSLPEQDQEFLPNYGRGLIFFYQNDFRTSANIFRKIVVQDPDGLFWGFESRNLLMKSLFMMDRKMNFEELDELLRLVKSFKVYVQRNQSLSNFHRKSYLNFAHYFGQLMKLREKEKRDSSEVNQLWKQIKQEKFITHKKWIKEVLQPSTD